MARVGVRFAFLRMFDYDIPIPWFCVCSDDGIASMHLNKIHFVLLSPCEPTQDVVDLLQNPK